MRVFRRRRSSWDVLAVRAGDRPRDAASGKRRERRPMGWVCVILMAAYAVLVWYLLDMLNVFHAPPERRRRRR